MPSTIKNEGIREIAGTLGNNKTDPGSLNWALFGASIIMVGAYTCRIGLFDPAVHKIGSILMHVCLGGLAGAVGLRAWAGDTGLYEVLAIGSSATWIVVSFKDWQHGVPDRALRTRSSGALIALNDLNELLHRK